MKQVREQLTESITFRVDAPTLVIIDKICAAEGRKRADVVRRIFVKAIKARGDRGKAHI